MSYVKGEFYRCVDNDGGLLPLTLGKAYQFRDVTNHYGALAKVLDDTGMLLYTHLTRFDPIPLWMGSSPTPSASQAATFQVLVNAAAAQAQFVGINVPKARAADECACGKKAEKKVFATFEYLYCSACKAEVGGKASA